MTDVPKIVHHRLRAATPERGHPEADLLTAFAEQALSATERGNVLQHLALCEDCRDVVALALPAMDVTVTPVESESKAVRAPLPDKTRSNWLTWANVHWGHLSWAALAAGIAVAVLVVRPGLEHPAKPNPPMSSVSNQTAAPVGPPAVTAQVAPGPIATNAKPEVADVKTQLSANKSRVAKPLPQAEGGLVIAGNARNAPSTAAKRAAPEPPQAPAFEVPRAMNETVDGSGASTTLTAQASTDSNLMAREEAPAIRRAKPPLAAEANEPAKTTMAGSSAQAVAPLNSRNVNTLVANGAAAQGTTLTQSASWTIAAGILQRSLDGGKSWQIALRAEHTLLCYANRGQEIWAGGEAGTLLHSTDGGTTWTAVGISFKGQPLGSDITHIEMRGLAGIILATGNHESWNSTDGGKSWEKH
jgi:hypothetical protein